MPKSPFRAGLGSPCPRTKTKPSAESRLRDAGFTRAEAYALRHWTTYHTIEKDFTPGQFAKAGKCSEATFSRLKDKKLLPRKGIVQISEAVAPDRSQKGARGLAARYRLAPWVYELVRSRRPNRLADCTPPLAFEVPISEVPTQVQHQHSLDPKNADASLRATEEAPVESPEVVQALVEQAGLDEQGAKTAAKALPVELQGEILPYLIRAALDEVEVRRQKGQLRKEPTHLLHFLLRSRDKELVSRARKLYEAGKARSEQAKAAGVGDAWAKATPSFRALPGAQEALHAWLTAQETARREEANPFGSVYTQQFHRDEARKACNALVEIAAQAHGLQRPEPGYRAKWRSEVLASIGLSEFDA